MQIAICGSAEAIEKLKPNLSEKHSYGVVDVTEGAVPAKEYDYYLIADAERAKSDEIADFLSKSGITLEKILCYANFIKNPLISPLEIYMRDENHTRKCKFLLGMSHSYGGIKTEIVQGKLIKLAAPSMDLFYHREALKNILATHDTTRISQIIFELPYYIFNYDVSRTIDTFEARTNFYYYLNDFHHYEEIEENRLKIQHFRMINSLFGDKPYHQIKDTVNRPVTVSRIRKLYRKYRYLSFAGQIHDWTEDEVARVKELRPHVWYKRHDKTITENIAIWNDIKQILSEYPNIDWKVVVFPFAPAFLENHKEAIAEKKKEFYDCLQIPENRVVDCYELYKSRQEFFEDECHLSMAGSIHFTKVFSKLM